MARLSHNLPTFGQQYFGGTHSSPTPLPLITPPPLQPTIQPMFPQSWPSSYFSFHGLQPALTQTQSTYQNLQLVFPQMHSAFQTLQPTLHHTHLTLQAMQTTLQQTPLPPAWHVAGQIGQALTPQAPLQHSLSYATSLLPNYVMNPSPAFSNFTFGISFVTSGLQAVGAISTGNALGYIKALSNITALALSPGPGLIYATGTYLWDNWVSPSVKQAIGQSIQNFGNQMGQTLYQAFIEPYMPGGGALPTGIPPDVGGVLFDKAAEVLTDLTEITGAYWDDKSEQLILTGRRNGSEQHMLLPTMDKDHLALALRAVLAGQPIGVSIDPPKEWREGPKQNQTPPEGMHMLVSYLGNTEGTLLGAIMFKADKLLKDLGSGLDNETRKPVRANVPGFKTELEMIYPQPGRKESRWHRFWFVVDKVELRQDSSRNCFTFGEVKIKVLTETQHGSGETVAQEPAAEHFARHLTQHYDEYAKEFPVLARLRELAKIIAVAKFLSNTGKTLDVGRLCIYEPQRVLTPKETPGIHVVSPNVLREGSIIHGVSLFGGVDLDFNCRILQDDITAQQLRKASENARPSLLTGSWDFRQNSSEMRAISTLLGTQSNGYRTSCVDLRIPQKDGSALEIRRLYNSLDMTQGDFGHGWHLYVPYKLVVLPPSSKRVEVLTSSDSGQDIAAPVFLLNGLTGEWQQYRRIDSRSSSEAETYCLTTSVESKEHQVSFQYDPSKSLRKLKDSFELSPGDGLTYHFNSQGKIVSIERNGRICISYAYADRHLSSISGSEGATVHFVHDPSGRILRTESSNGTACEYLYDEYGDLIWVRNSQGNIKEYRYDWRHLLIEERDGIGHMLRRNSYDDLGRLTRDRSCAVHLGTGIVLNRHYDEQNRLIQEDDISGNSARYSYSEDGSLTRVIIKDQLGSEANLAYDLSGRLVGAKAKDKKWLELSYDDNKQIATLRDARGNIHSFTYDAHKNHMEMYDAEGNEWGLDVHSSGDGLTMTDPNGQAIILKLDASGILSIERPDEKVEFHSNKKWYTIRALSRGKRKNEVILDKLGRVTRLKASGNSSIKFNYDGPNYMESIADNYGEVCRYDHDEGGLSVRTTLFV